MRVFFIAVVLVFAVSTNAKQAKVAVKLNDGLKSSIRDIANRFLSHEDTMNLAELSTPKEDIINALLEMQRNLIQEQNAADNAFGSFEESLTTTISNTQEDIDTQHQIATDASRQIEILLAQIQGLKVDIQSHQDDISGLDISIKGKQAEQQTLRDAHQAAQSDFNDKIRAHHESLETLQGLVDLVNDLKFDDVLKTLNKHKSSHMHPSSKSLVKLVTAAVKLIKQNGPTRNQIKQKLLDLLGQIKAGTEDSLRRYLGEQSAEQETFDQADSAISALLEGFVNSIGSHKDAIVADESKLAELQVQLEQAEAARDNALATGSSLQQYADETSNLLENKSEEHAADTADRTQQLNDLEAAIQYVNEHVAGLSVAGLCNVESTTCFRCLTNEQCQFGDICGSNGRCQPKPVPVDVSGSADETTVLTLTCPNGKTFSNFIFASYGMPVGDQIADYCHAESTPIIVKNACLGQNSCSVSATNNVFGDPCYGIRKHLNIHLQCL